MKLARVETSMRVGDQAFEAIHEAIMSGELRAGHRLQIRPLAEALGTSVMPVREAIKRLEEIGLVEAAPYRGAVVKEFTTAELRQVYAVRRLLEGEAARLGTPALTKGMITRLRKLRARAAKALGDAALVDYIDTDEEFLQVIYDAAANPVLVETIGVLWKRCRSYKLVGVRRQVATGRAEELLTHLDGLIDAASAKDGALAQRVTLESIDAATSRIGSALTSDVETRSAGA